MTTTTIKTFAQLYDETGTDAASGGPYNTLLAPFAVPPTATAWRPNDLLRQVTVEADPTFSMAFVGLFPYDGEPAGRTRLIHAPAIFPRPLGRRTSYDGKVYAFLGDVVGGTITTVECPPLAASVPVSS